jgi:hypothetical protein
VQWSWSIRAVSLISIRFWFLTSRSERPRAAAGHGYVRTAHISSKAPSMEGRCHPYPKTRPHVSSLLRPIHFHSSLC